MTARAAKPPACRRLFEEAPQGAGLRVDRDKGIIFGVKVLSRTSPNTHATKATKGTEYTPEAMRKALPLYEGAEVYKNHQAKEQAGQVRPIEEKMGWLTGARLEGDGVYADLHLYKEDPDSGKIFEAAERNPAGFALSHEAYGSGDVVNGVFVIHEIPEVTSVDIVTKGGTNRSLKESAHVATKIKIRDALTRHVLPTCTSVKQAARCKAVIAAVAEAAEMDDSAGDHRDHLYAAHKACQESGDDETADKILGLLKTPKDKPDEKKKPTEEADEEDDDGAMPAKESAEDDDDDPDKKKKAAESRKRKAAPKGAVPLQEALVKKLVANAGLKDDVRLTASLMAMGSADLVLDHLQYLREAAPTTGGGRGDQPRSATQGAGAGGAAKTPLKLSDVSRALRG